MMASVPRLRPYRTTELRGRGQTRESRPEHHAQNGGPRRVCRRARSARESGEQEEAGTDEETDWHAAQTKPTVKDCRRRLNSFIVQ